MNHSTRRPRACSLEQLFFFHFPSIRIHPTAQMDLTSPPLPLVTKKNRSLEISTGRIQIHHNKNHACTIVNNKNKSRNHNEVAPLSRDTQPSSDSSVRTVLPDNDIPFQKILIHAIEYDIISPQLSQPMGILQTLKQNEECQ